MVLISVYGTVFNNAYILRESLNSLMNSLEYKNIDYEIVVVDNYSTDGTWNILKEFKEKYPRKIKIFRSRSSRGKGRDIALKYTNGDLVFYVDFDCVFDKLLGILVDKLRRIISRNEIWNNGFTHRDTMINIIGGWKDLNFGEDWEMYARAITRGIKSKWVTIIPPFINVKYSKLRHGEFRYVNNYFQRIVRRVRNIVDSFLSLRMPKQYVFYNNWHILTKMMYMSLSFHYTINIFSNKSFFRLVSKFYNTTCFTYINRDYVYPEEIGINRDLYFLLFEDFDICFEHMKSKLISLLNKDKLNIKITYDKVRRKLYLYRNERAYLKGLYRLYGVDVDHIRFVA